MNRGAQLLAPHVGRAGSQAALAEALTIDQGNLSRYLRGLDSPGLGTRRRLYDALGIPMHTWDDPPVADADAPSVPPHQRPDGQPADPGEAA